MISQLYFNTHNYSQLLLSVEVDTPPLNSNPDKTVIGYNILVLGNSITFDPKLLIFDV